MRQSGILDSLAARIAVGTETIKFKTTGLVEFGRGCHFLHAHPWLACHRSVNLNMTALLLTLSAILERDGKLDPNLFLQCDAGDGNWDDGQIVMLAILVQVDMVEVLVVHRSPVAHTHNIGDAYWSTPPNAKGSMELAAKTFAAPTSSSNRSTMRTVI